MLHLRVIAPEELGPRAMEILERFESVTNLVRLPQAAARPRGDLLMCDVAREDGSVVLAALRRIDLDRKGSIAIEEVDVSLSDAADAAEQGAEGSPGDAVLWEGVESATWSSAELTTSFVVFMLIATLLGGFGILTDSVVLLIGAMVVGPEFGPLAGVCVASVKRRPALALRSLWALLVGFGVGIGGTWLCVVALQAAALTPPSLARTNTLFVSHPDAYSVLTALVAGVAGMLSLSTSKSGALIGVLISVTTIPAAANMAVAGAYGDADELTGATLQLAVNVSCIVVAGTLALAVQRLAFVARMRRAIVRRRTAARRRRRREAA